MAFGSEYSYVARWGRWQRLYIRLLGVVDLPTRLRARSLQKELSRIPSGSLVDFGAGTGVYSYFLSRDNAREVIAVDIDSRRVADIIEVARSTDRSRLKALCATEDFFLNRSDQQLAAILMIEVLVYCDDAIGMLKSIHANLRGGGVLIGHVPVRERLFAHERHLINQERLATWLREAGFESVTIRPSLGPGAERLSAIFEAVANRPMLLPVVYPALLLLMHFTRRRPRTGNSLAFVARKADLISPRIIQSAAVPDRASKCCA